MECIRYHKCGRHLISSDVQCVQARMQLHHLSQHLHHQPDTLLFVWVQGAHTIGHLSQTPQGSMFQYKLTNNAEKKGQHKKKK